MEASTMMAMSWRDLLKRNRNTSACQLTEPPKAPFVSYGSEQNVDIREISQPIERTVVRFRLPGGCPRSSCTAIGTKTRAEIVADLRRRHGNDVEVLP
jgi:hypothetical protein